MVLTEGRPDTNDGRLDKELRVYDLLDKLNVRFHRVDHEAAMTMEACAAVDLVLGTPMCKNLLLCNRQKTDFYLLLIPGEKVFQTKELSAQLGVSRLSFASGEAMEEFLDITPGSLSIMGLMNDKELRVRLVIDAPVLEHEYICVHPCVNTSSLRLKTADMLDIIIPAMGHAPTIVHLP